MSQLKVYEYSKCSTCRKGLKFLDSHTIPYEKIPIVENAPTKDEIKKMINYYDGDIRKLFNISGVVYREMGLSNKIKTMGIEEAVDLLASNGKLVKRPFVLAERFGLVGFKEDEWKEALNV